MLAMSHQEATPTSQLPLKRWNAHRVQIALLRVSVAVDTRTVVATGARSRVAMFVAGVACPAELSRVYDLVWPATRVHPRKAVLLDLSLSM